MNKKYIDNFDELKQIQFLERSKYYYTRNLMSQLNSFKQDNEEFVAVKELHGINLLVRPFWDDEPTKVNDRQLQRFLDIEGEEQKRYMKIHPEFCLMLRKNVLEKLKEAQGLFPQNIRIVVKAGYRPLEVQQNLFDFIFDMLKIKHKSYSDDEIYRLTSEYVTDPRKFMPPHSTGGAVDIHLFDTEVGKYLDMGSPINYPDDISWTFNFDSLTNEQIKNRLLITNTMIRAGFANLASEWWHYSYGDPRWAIFYDKSEALYSSK